VCHEPSAAGEPLIVDWKAEDRADLEVALKKGVAIVHYDCKTVKLLADCNARGKYEYAGVTKKEQLIQLADADEAKANLPFSGGSVGGGLARGSELDIALAMIGKRSTAFSDLARSELKGKCEGATHFVRAATLGAFAMTTATVGEITAAADLFGTGASAKSSSKRNVTTKDGDTAACDKADPNGSSPPGQCGAVLRLQLLALAAQPGSKAPAGPAAGGLSCPQGLIATNGKCAAPKNDNQRQCAAGKAEACDAVCRTGDIDACIYFSQVVLDEAERKQDRALAGRAAPALAKACDAGHANSCALLGNMIWDGNGVPKDVNRGRDLVIRACDAGSGIGCGSLGNAFITGDGAPHDAARGLRLTVRGCQLGGALACVLAGQQLAKSPSKSDHGAAADFFVRGCDGRNADGCMAAGVAFDRGDGVTPDKSFAAELFAQACRLGQQDGCRAAKGGRR
jgi:hypothetical protein